MYIIHLFSPNFSMIYENFLKKKIDLSRGPFHIGKIWNTEGTETPVWIIKLFNLSSFDLSRVDCIQFIKTFFQSFSDVCHQTNCNQLVIFSTIDSGLISNWNDMEPYLNHDSRAITLVTSLFLPPSKNNWIED